MTFLVANIPPVKCFVRKEFLYNHEKGHGELEPCVWMTAKDEWFYNFEEIKT
jgi:hypothetical protein